MLRKGKNGWRQGKDFDQRGKVRWSLGMTVVGSYRRPELGITLGYANKAYRDNLGSCPSYFEIFRIS